MINDRQIAHAELVLVGARWAKRNGFSVVATELRSCGSLEIPDVIAFRSNCSLLIEAKTSRADFLADAKKPWRATGAPSVGTYRFYLTPPDVISHEDLPAGWGLIHASCRKTVDVVRPLGNLWPSYEHAIDSWCEFRHISDALLERSILFSIARRK